MNIKPHLQILMICFILLGCTSASQALNGDVLTITGELQKKSYETFDLKLKSRKISKVIFKNCVGGSTRDALLIAFKIRTNNINTMASGQVQSACAFAFLGGTTRKIDPEDGDHLIMFHGELDPANLKPVGVEKNRAMLDVLYKFVGVSFGSDVQNIILNTQNSNEGVYFLRQQSNGAFVDYTYYCDGKSIVNASNCKKIDRLSLESEGIITQ